MASQPETKIDTAKADAAAEKAYAAAAGEVGVKTAPSGEAPKVEAKAATPKAETPKIDRAVAEVKAAPAKKAPAQKAAPKKAVARKAPAKKVVKKAAARKAAPKKTVLKAKPAAKPAAAGPVSTISNLKDKIMATAKNTATTDFTAGVKTAAADAQTRAKAAYDKLQAYAGEMTEFTKGNVEALVLKAMAAVKSPTELFKLQGEIARRNFDAAVAHYSKNAEVGMKLAGDAFAPLSSRVSLAVEKFSKAA
jgi:hypothetical protein